MSRRKDAAILSFLTKTEVSEKSVPSVPLSDTDGLCQYTFTAPWDGHRDEDRCLFLGDSVASLTVSNYPENEGKRFGDPICDCVGAGLYGNRVVACIADGCNWGMPPRDAAQSAVSAFLEHVLGQNLRGCRDTRAVAKLLLHALASAHSRIISGCPADEIFTRGTTTFLGGVASEARVSGSSTTASTHGTRHSRWNYVLISIGDCKAFKVSPARGEVEEIGGSCRSASEDATDCGGRIGPYNGYDPDLRNLSFFHGAAEEGDLIVLVTDGVHDNLDPEMIGKTPQEAGSPARSWKEMDALSKDLAKRTYSLAILRELLADATDPKGVCERLVNYSQEVTQAGRDWLEEHPKERIPDDHVRFPGKMDHCTSLCFRVGRHRISASDERELPQNFNITLMPVGLDDRTKKKGPFRSLSWQGRSAPQQVADNPAPSAAAATAPVSIPQSDKLRDTKATKARPRVIGIPPSPPVDEGGFSKRSSCMSASSHVRAISETANAVQARSAPFLPSLPIESMSPPTSASRRPKRNSCMYPMGSEATGLALNLSSSLPRTVIPESNQPICSARSMLSARSFLSHSSAMKYENKSPSQVSASACIGDFRAWAAVTSDPDMGVSSSVGSGLKQQPQQQLSSLPSAPIFDPKLCPSARISAILSQDDEDYPKTRPRAATSNTLTLPPISTAPQRTPSARSRGPESTRRVPL